MSVYGRHYEPGQLQFITTSTYRRAKLFERDLFRWYFVQVLRQLPKETGFLIIGWVLMPEHFHILIKPEPAEATSRFMQELKKRTAQRFLNTLMGSPNQRWCRAMLARLRLPPTVTLIRIIASGSGVLCLSTCIRRRKCGRSSITCTTIPVKRKLISSPDQWPWSSFRFYYLSDSSLLKMDRVI